MERIIYHGSDHRIELPAFGQGKRYNDYGLGFYCTENIDLAKEWSVGENTDGFANRYRICEEGLEILNLNSRDFSALHWIELLLRNRTFDLSTPIAKEAARYLHENFKIDTSNTDVIIGYRADDSYFTYAQEFLNGAISLRQLSDAMHLGELGLQYVLKSEKAFGALRQDGYEIASASEWYPRKKGRDVTARRKYYDMNREGYVKGELYMVQILDEEVKANDPRIR